MAAGARLHGRPGHANLEMELRGACFPALCGRYMAGVDALPTKPYGWYMQAVESQAALVSLESIEQELTLLVRRAQKVQLRGGPTEHVVDRAAYGILAWLHDNGPLRPSALAAHFHLDASTISRQVAGLERAGLVAREPDSEDGRACRLRLTERGQDVLLTTRAERRGVVRELLQSWSPQDLAKFASLLAAFNAGLDTHMAPDLHSPEGNPR